ncbi:30S ribosomal protein S4 [Candidatus Jorgensenbacteria bacterium]|nr:30S ribosomal protein S4 [Candidatus Jorgensenbacteria bacterium]
MRPLKEKKERSLGVKLFLKAERCNSPKCVTVRRPYRPGVHGQKRKTLTEYGRQFQEKQKIQIYYGLTNRQMRELFRSSSKDKIVERLQHRLDQAVFLLGFGSSPRVARQLVSHGHILVNNRKVTVPSYYVTIGDVIAVRSMSRSTHLFDDIALKLKQYTPPPWLTLNADELKGECVVPASADNTTFPFDINLVGEFYSR